MSAKVYSLEEELSRRLPPFRLGTLEVEAKRIKLVADCRLTTGAARTLAAQLIALADQVDTNG